ncbi:MULTISPECIES: phthiocerol/phthiodiolone dimycocerosyl transferase family protein [unclassified Solwaraspora]|uniref:phthiocerol/phthiodiolone dimycocerosyl transferase family protein n=1 Tax=unclassified Solwaraspora TaxID=2627926 RepID=UPI00259B5E27|nr:hypothetical protein [Solwaraspora sp. WMMA2056]WJK39431.1 hypothetical protein O7608_23650 [Solwaraspora sp. WMMA2056]
MSSRPATTGPVSAKAVVDRELSPVERWYWIADQLSPLTVIGRVRVHATIAGPVLRAALDAVQRRHPLLQVAIRADEDGRHPRYVPTDRPVPLREPTAAGPDDADSWVRWCNEHELVDPIDRHTGPLARATALTIGGDAPPAVDLIIALPHGVADGTTVLALVRQWAQQCARLAAGPDDGAAPPPLGPAAAASAWSPARERALPPPDDLLPEPHRGAAGAAVLQAKQERDERDVGLYRPARFEPGRYVPFERRRTGLIHRELSADQLTALADACRREGTTVHGALVAALAGAVAAERSDVVYLMIGSPIDFRGALEPPVGPDEVGTYVATVPSLVDCRPTATVWDRARSVSADVARRRDLGEHLALVNLVRGGCPPTVAEGRPFLEFMEQTSPINLCVSNVGRYDLPDRLGDWALSGAQFVTGLSVNGYFVATVTTSGGRLFWNFTYVREAVDEQRAVALVDTCLHTLLTALAAARTEQEDTHVDQS